MGLFLAGELLTLRVIEGPLEQGSEADAYEVTSEKERQIRSEDPPPQRGSVVGFELQGEEPGGVKEVEGGQ